MQCTCTEGQFDPSTGIQIAFPVIWTHPGSQYMVSGNVLSVLSLDKTSVHEHPGMC